MRQLKCLDRWIRGRLYNYFFTKYKVRLPKKYFRMQINCKHSQFLNNNIVSLFKEACYIKKYYAKNPNLTYCNCDIYNPIEFGYV